MASFAAVAARIRAACAKGAQARTALEQAEDLAEEAHATLARALEGAHHLDADAAQVLSAFTRVVDGCKGYLWPLLNEVLKNAERYADSLVSEPSAHQAAPDDPPAVPANRIEQLRRELPPPVTRGAGQQTHGRWIGPDGTRTRTRYTGGAQPWWT